MKLESRRVHPEQRGWAAGFHLDLWMYCECLRLPKPVCNSNAAVSVANKGHTGTERHVN